MAQTEEGRRILKKRPLLSSESLNLPALRRQEPSSLGGAYASFMDSHDFSPDERGLVSFETDEELAYVMTRYRQVHDFWHVLSGLPTSVVGELALKCFEFVQV